MIDHLITCGLCHLFGPIQNITEIQFGHIPASLADDMVMVVVYFTEFISNTRTIDDFKNHAPGFEEVKRAVDRGQSNFLLLFEKASVEFLRTQRGFGIGEFLIN
jgi:hypothetical protein